MSPRAFARCPAFEPRASRGFAAFLIALHGAAAAAAVVAQIPWLSKPLVVVMLGVSLWRALCLHAWRSAPGAVVRIAPRDDGTWLVQSRDGRASVGPLLPDSFVHPWLVIVGVRDGWRTRFVPVPQDSLAADAHRRLRVLVKWAPSSHSARGSRWPFSRAPR